MRPTAFGLHALIGSAAASHECLQRSWAFTDTMAATLKYSNEGSPIMDQWGDHSVSSKVQTFKNGRGRVDINTDGGWSAHFDGHN